MAAPAFPASLPPAAFARLVGLSPSRLRELAGTGAIPKNDRGHYDLPAALHAYVERLRGQAAARTSGTGHDLVAERSRLAAAQADLAELRVAQERRELVNAGQVERGYIALVTQARNRLLGVPSAAKGHIPGLSVDQVELLEGLIVDALEAVANGDDEAEPDADEEHQ